MLFRGGSGASRRRGSVCGIVIVGAVTEHVVGEVGNAVRHIVHYIANGIPGILEKRIAVRVISRSGAVSGGGIIYVIRVAAVSEGIVSGCVVTGCGAAVSGSLIS